MKTNCWEFMRCGHKPNGEKAICPAATDSTLDGTNGGCYAGRCCWRVAGTYCNGKVQGAFASKIMDCVECNFFKKVKEEEGKDFQFLISIPQD